MKCSSLALFSALLAAPVCCYAGDQLIPAGSLIQCTVSEPKLSSKTTAIGDPVLCQMGHAERYGRSVLPTNSYLVGRFEDYKDPGHFVGKGWMELRFDRMVIEPNTIVPVDAKVVAVPGYNVDRDGRILGKGHVARDIVLWSIPILWPVDLLMLPARGPRPTLKEETRLTLKVMDDLSIPQTAEPQRDPYGLIQRGPTAESAPPPEPYADQPPPQDQAQAQDAPTYAPDPAPAPVYAYAPPPPPAYAYAAPPPVVYGYGGGAAIGIYGGYGVGPRGYAAAPRANAYRGPVRTYGNGGSPTRPAPRGYGYTGAPRSYGYAGAPRSYAYGGAARGYAGQPYAAQPRMAAGYGYGGGRSAGMAQGGMGRGGAGRPGR